MIRVLKLLNSVIKGHVPVRALGYGLLNKLHYLIKSGNRRFEFERLYLDRPDPWNYSTSSYENSKYKKTLDVALNWCGNRGRALEVGCSIGIFTELIAGYFGNVVAVDLSTEAVRSAIKYNKLRSNICFRREDIRSMTCGEKFNVIFCSEVLYYMRSSDVPAVSERLNSLLEDGGVLIMVSGLKESNSDSEYFGDWDQVFTSLFEYRVECEVLDVDRPYRILLYAHTLPCADVHNGFST
jgi:SAM-dependent methyltransferase